MLFPGAIIIVSIFLIALGACLSIAIGFLGGIAASTLFKSVVYKTKLYKRLVKGEKIAWPWWIDHRHWFTYGWIFSFCIVAYTIAGPIWAAIEYFNK